MLLRCRWTWDSCRFLNPEKFANWIDWRKFCLKEICWQLKYSRHCCFLGGIGVYRKNWRDIAELLGSESERRFASETVEELLENKMFYLFSITKIHKRFHTDLVAILFFWIKKKGNLPQKTSFTSYPCIATFYVYSGPRSMDRELTGAVPLSIAPRRLS